MDCGLGRPLPAGVGIVTQWFGDRPAYYARWDLAGHNGLDYGVVVGTPVLSALEGVVQRIGDDVAGYGLFVRVANGYMVSLYGHLSSILCQVGDHVDVGQQIGLSGNTGNSTGPHLHWGIRWVRGRNPAYGDWVDPAPLRV